MSDSITHPMSTDLTSKLDEIELGLKAGLAWVSPRARSDRDTIQRGIDAVLALARLGMRSEAVTDDMVEQGALAACKHVSEDEGEAFDPEVLNTEFTAEDRENMRRLVRAILTAALRSTP